MKVTVRGQGPITLSDNDFIAQGGEGRVYAKGSLVYKVHHDPQQMIPEGKIRELQQLTRKNVIVPKDLLLNEKNQPIGYTATRIQDGLPLPRLFTEIFRKREGIQDQTIIELIAEMIATIRHIHQQRCLMVDGNELNYLVGKDYVTPYFIDTNSYQTPTYPASAQMVSIRDFHSKAFSENTDWFSFAIVSCQLLVGIHPYKGSHPGFKKGDLEGRMRGNVSIFNPDTSLPAAARDLSCIPAAFKDWFIRLFERGERRPPPDPRGLPLPLAAPAVPTPISATVALELVKQVLEEVIQCELMAGLEVITTPTHFLVEGRAHDRLAGESLIITPAGQVAVAVSLEGGVLRLRRLLSGEPIAVNLQGEGFLVVDNTLHLFNQGVLSELRLHEAGPRIMAGVVRSQRFLPNATRLYDGFLLTDALGKPVVGIPHRPGAVAVLPLPELLAGRVIEGRYRGGVLVAVVMTPQGTFDQWIFRFDQAHKSYHARRVEGLSRPEVDFAVLDGGVCVLAGDNDLTLFSRDPGQHAMRVIQDPGLPTGSRLFAHGGQLRCMDGARILRLRMV